MITDLFPKISPSLDLNFARAQKLDSRISFSRPSAATYFDRNGILRTAASGVPRFDFDPITGACKGLLIEEQRTNLLTYSDQFDNAAWVKTRASITANAAIAPDGTLTADKLVEDITGSSTHALAVGITLATNTAATASVYVKAAEKTYVGLRITADGTNHVFCGFNLSTGVAGTPENAGNGSGATGSIVSVGGGWYRCSLSGIHSTTASNPTINVYIGSNGTSLIGGNFAYTGDGTSGIYIWGAQAEVGSFPTSYIKTEAAQATRAADVATMTGANFSNWYRQDEGTFFGEAAFGFVPSASQFPRLMAASNDTAAESHQIYFTSTNAAVYEIRDEGVQQASMTRIDAAPAKWAGAYKLNDCAFAVDASAVSTDTSATMPAPDRLFIGANHAGSNLANGHISRLAYYPKRLTNTELQALTA